LGQQKKRGKHARGDRISPRIERNQRCPMDVGISAMVYPANRKSYLK
jgi:hypothetical protein